MLETKALKHFWIKIAPPGVEAGALLRGTLICEDSERAIIDAVNEFSSESSRKTGRNWFVEILRPDLSPVFPPTRFSIHPVGGSAKARRSKSVTARRKTSGLLAARAAKARLRAEPAK